MSSFSPALKILEKSFFEIFLERFLELISPDKDPLDEDDDERDDEQDVGEIQDELVDRRHRAVLLHPPRVEPGVGLGGLVDHTAVGLFEFSRAKVLLAEVAVQRGAVDYRRGGHD